MTPTRRETTYLAQTGRVTFTAQQERRYAKKLHVPAGAASSRPAGDPLATPPQQSG